MKKFTLILAAAVLAPAALGYGMAFAALQGLSAPAPAAQCGTPDEDPKRCSREGLQADDDRGTGRLAGIAGDGCDKGSRDCFPAERTGWRGLSVLMG